MASNVGSTTWTPRARRLRQRHGRVERERRPRVPRVVAESLGRRHGQAVSRGRREGEHAEVGAEGGTDPFDDHRGHLLARERLRERGREVLHERGAGRRRLGRGAGGALGREQPLDLAPGAHLVRDVDREVEDSGDSPVRVADRVVPEVEPGVLDPEPPAVVAEVGL
jgi:hypothetical protein